MMTALGPCLSALRWEHEKNSKYQSKEFAHFPSLESNWIANKQKIVFLQDVIRSEPIFKKWVQHSVDSLAPNLAYSRPPKPHTRTLVEDLEDPYDPLRTRRIQNGVATQSDPIFLDHQLASGELSGIIGWFGVGR
jgi:hypothetical protein